MSNDISSHNQSPGSRSCNSIYYIDELSQITLIYKFMMQYAVHYEKWINNFTLLLYVDHHRRISENLVLIWYIQLYLLTKTKLWTRLSNHCWLVVILAGERLYKCDLCNLTRNLLSVGMGVTAQNDWNMISKKNNTCDKSWCFWYTLILDWKTFTFKIQNWDTSAFHIRLPNMMMIIAEFWEMYSIHLWNDCNNISST